MGGMLPGHSGLTSHFGFSRECRGRLPIWRITVTADLRSGASAWRLNSLIGTEDACLGRASRSAFLWGRAQALCRLSFDLSEAKGLLSGSGLVNGNETARLRG